jgi:peptide subunit release factor 1 (eRF1)
VRFLPTSPFNKIGGKSKVITIAIPPQGNAPDIKSEIGTAKNIKDKKTRDNVITGLNKISNYL